jgi:hypothetical protein
MLIYTKLACNATVVVSERDVDPRNRVAPTRWFPSRLIANEMHFLCFMFFQREEVVRSDKKPRCYRWPEAGPYRISRGHVHSKTWRSTSDR